MQIVVLGAAGRIGEPIVDAAERRGHRVVRVTSVNGPGAAVEAALAEAFAAADAVVDALDIATVRRRPAVVAATRATRRVVAAAARAEVPHLVAMSVWHAAHPAVARHGYLAATAARERGYRLSGVPLSIVRSTPWFELAEQLVTTARGPVALVPHVLSRPVAASAAASAAVDLAEGAPRPEGAVVAGPDALDLVELARHVAAARGGRPRVLPVGRLGRVPGLLCPPDDIPGVGPAFAEWLATRPR